MKTLLGDRGDRYVEVCHVMPVFCGRGGGGGLQQFFLFVYKNR